MALGKLNLIMNYEDVKAKLLWNWTHDEPIASEIYTEDALLEFPQSGEKFRGKENFITLAQRASGASYRVRVPIPPR